MMAMKTSKLPSLGDRHEISRHTRHASTPSGGRNRWSESGYLEDVLNLTARRSYSSNSNAEELIKEITAIELEIIHMERHILSLYQTAFAQYLVNSPTSGQDLSSNTNFQAEVTMKGGHCLQEFHGNAIKPEGLSSDNGFQTDETVAYSKGRYRSSSVNNGALPRSMFPPREITENTLVKAASCHGTLADHLCASLRDSIFCTPCKLSEDIIKCISAVYFKLNVRTTRVDYSSSPFSSLSSSTTFSLPEKSDTWSPRCYCEPTSPSQLETQKEKNHPSNGMVQITKICIDKDRFKCAAELLEGHRSLVRHLKSINPSKLDHEEKLAFWINIHNALVMHAFIAYGLESNHISITPSIMKKSYNVGGVDVNAREIQSSILGCRTPCPEARIRSLLTPRRRLSTSNSKHVYALDRPEPLVHFALCFGAYSDPSVRVYTSKNVTDQLQVAKEEFIQTNFRIHRETRVMLPKILEIYAKDASLELSGILEMVHDCLPEGRKNALRQCIKRNQRKFIEWSSYKSTFRYVFHRDLNPGN